MDRGLRDCPACGQLTDVHANADGTLYFENHIEVLTDVKPYWMDDNSASFTMRTRLCPASGQHVD